MRPLSSTSRNNLERNQNMVRFKNRYVVLQVTPYSKDDQQVMFKNSALSHAVSNKVQQLFGDLGVALIKNGFDVKYCNKSTKITIMKIRHGPHKIILRAIPLINNVGGQVVVTNILYIGASLNHCFLFIRKHQQKNLEQTWSKLRTESERKEMERALMTLTLGAKDLN